MASPSRRGRKRARAYRRTDHSLSGRWRRMKEGSCRSCGAELEHTFCDLGMSPLSNAFLTAEQLERMEPFYPLHAYVCGRCFLVQLQEFESPRRIFAGDYAY